MGERRTNSFLVSSFKRTKTINEYNATELANEINKLISENKGITISNDIQRKINSLLNNYYKTEYELNDKNSEVSILKEIY